jgi:hypothetical protein
MAKCATPKTTEGRVAKLRALASLTAEAALTAAPDRQMTVFDAAEQLVRVADGLERRGRKEFTEPPIAELPSNATTEEVRNARRRQATRRGTEVYLPSWSAMAQALPNTFLRSALFSSGRNIQAENAKVLSGDQTLLVAGKEIAWFQNLTLTFSGYELCQFDRHVYRKAAQWRPHGHEGGWQGLREDDSWQNTYCSPAGKPTNAELGFWMEASTRVTEPQPAAKPTRTPELDVSFGEALNCETHRRRFTSTNRAFAINPPLFSRSVTVSQRSSPRCLKPYR